METETNTQPTTLSERIARYLADEYGLPSHNQQGDPLTRCLTCGVVIYAVAELGDLRSFCSDHRGPIPGNLDPWAGEVDPDAQARWAARYHAEARRDLRNQDQCGCWQRDCDECGRRRSDGQRPRPGIVARFNRAAAAQGLR